jgi:HAMP domain-containing protein
MKHTDDGFEAWLDEIEKEADRVNRMKDYRQRSASDLLLNINRVRITTYQMSNGAAVDPAEIEALVRNIQELRDKLRK